MAEQKRPGRTGCTVSLILLVVGIGAGVLGGLNFYKGVAETAQHRFVAPGSYGSMLEAGEYKLSQEHESELDGKAYSAPPGLGNLQVRLVPQGGGDEIALIAPGIRETYSIGARQGVVLRRFTITQPGEYVFESAYPPGVTGAETVLAVGQGDLVGGILGMCFAMPLAAIFLIAALIIGIISLVNRSSAKREAARAAPG